MQFIFMYFYSDTLKKEQLQKWYSGEKLSGKKMWQKTQPPVNQPNNKVKWDLMIKEITIFQLINSLV